MVFQLLSSGHSVLAVFGLDSFPLLSSSARCKSNYREQFQPTPTHRTHKMPQSHPIRVPGQVSAVEGKIIHFLRQFSPPSKENPIYMLITMYNQNIACHLISYPLERGKHNSVGLRWLFSRVHTRYRIKDSYLL